MAVEATFILAVGDGTSGGDYIDLNNDAGNFTVAFFDEGRPYDRRFKTAGRAMTLGLNVEGASITQVWDLLNAVETKLAQARLASVNPQGGHTFVTLGVKLGSASTMVYFDIVDGTLSRPREMFSVSMEQGAVEFNGAGSGVILELQCLPFGRSDPIVYGPFSVSKADGFSFYQASIPGTAPALVTYSVVDSTSGQVLNKLLIGHRSQPDLDSGDWDPVIDATASGGGSNGPGSITDAIGSNYATDTVTATQPWTEIANVQPATPYLSQAGKYDVWARVYDALNVPQPPRNVQISSRSISGSMPAGNYTILVVSVDTTGGTFLSAPGDLITVRVGGLIDEFTVDWDAPAIGSSNIDDYRVYWKRDNEAWKYKAVGGTTTQLNITTESGATTADPPDEPSVLPVRWRGTVSFSSGTKKITGKPVSSALSNDTYEIVKLFSGVTLPPQSLEEGGTVESWRIGIEAFKNDLAVAAAEGRVDAVWILPSESVVEAEYLGLDLGTTREWVIGQTRHGNVHGVLRNKSGGAEVGVVSVYGLPQAGPGDTQWGVLPLVAGGVSNVGAIDLEFTITAVPRWTSLRGT